MRRPTTPPRAPCVASLYRALKKTASEEKSTIFRKKQQINGYGAPATRGGVRPEGAQSGLPLGESAFFTRARGAQSTARERHATFA